MLKPQSKNVTLFILGLIMFVNALSYGTIVPLLYPYASRFGIGPFGLSMLFASFSLAQFLATPIIGRLSDKYGRKPLLLLCLFGTSISLALFASAQNMLMLFVARICDGITGGNNSVAQAIIADSTTGAERAKGFGVLGASYGLGFLLGPAMGGIIGQYGLSAPFWFASLLALIGTILGVLILKETVPEGNKKMVNKEPLINFQAIFKALLSPISGLVLAISFIAALAINSFIFGFQTYSNDVLRMTPAQVGVQLAIFGLVSIVMQMVGLRILLDKVKSRSKIITISFLASAILMVLVAFTKTPLSYGVILLLFAIFSSPQNPVITGLLSERTRAEDQGGLLGINQSYISLGQIFGPLAAGAIASTVSVAGAFILAGGLYVFGTVATYWLYKPVKAKTNI